MQRVVNYGSFLQAFSLKNTVESMGHDCVFLDIADDNGTFDYAERYAPKGYWYRSLYRKLMYPSHKRMYQEREYLFKKKLLPLLNMTPEYSKTEDCDVVIFGSDEIFNCCQESPWGKTLNLLGKNIQADKMISYAASFGFTTIEMLKENGMYDMAAACLKRFDALSVRDSNSAEIVKELVEKELEKHLDPVLIYDYPQRKKYKPHLKNYVVVYGYDNRICEPDMIECIQQFARKRRLKTVALGMQQDWCDINYLPHPFELLSLIEQADYVVTDTFHGTIFSIKYQKQFATIIRNNNSQKLSDLLATFGLCERNIRNAQDIEKILESSYNKDCVRQTISKQKEATLRYLNRWLTNENR